MEPQRPAWTLSEAVARTSSSRSTLRRHLEQGRLPNAFKDTAGAWRFPVDDLLAAGVTMVKSKPDAVVSTPTEQAAGQGEQPMSAPALRILELEHQLAVERERSAGLERLAGAAQANADDLRRALLMLGSASPGQAPEQPVSVSSDHAQGNVVSGPVPAPAGPVRRRWPFGRRA